MTEETSLRENDSLNENRKNLGKKLSFTEKYITLLTINFRFGFFNNISRLFAKNGETDANFFSVWAFGYLDEIFSKGNQKPIQEWRAI